MSAIPTTRPEAAQAPPRRAGWTVRISPDVDLSKIPANVFKMAAILERLYRTSPAAFPPNRTLAARYGCTLRQAQSIVAEMERLGFLVREFEAAGRTMIRALRRLDLDLPVDERPTPSQAIPPHEVFFVPPHEVFFVPPTKKTSCPPSSPPEPPYGGPRASEDSGKTRGEKDYLPTPNPIPDPPACACEGRATARHPLNPFADPPPEVIAADPILSREWAARAARAGRVGS